MHISRRKHEAEGAAGAAGVTVLLARAVRLVGDSRSALAGATTKT
jgi:hypothetical protein